MHHNLDAPAIPKYNTFSKTSESEFKVKNSKFVCFGACVSSESEIHDILKSRKTICFSAKRHVYAYNLLNNKFKACDDGEPKNSSGAPILTIITLAKLKNIIIIISRYFGGTLLGIGGLIKAYTQGAQLTIKNSEIKIMTLCTVFEINFDYDVSSVIFNLLNLFNIKILRKNYDMKIKLKCYCPEENFSNFEYKISEVSHGDLKLNLLAYEYY
ncbi:MAG: YigZ family protein [Candidatus Improbicoccus devescovinae]|nr:MAG: YigZ family protein [Candidatus Improbicoccus devescovinae]